MTRKFKHPDYEATLNTPILLKDALCQDHLARFVVEIILQLDLSKIYAGYAEKGGEAIAPECLLGLLFYGYASGIFSSRKLEKASYENLGVRYVAGGLHPDHDTIANFRKTYLSELQGLFVQILLLAKVAGVLKMGNLSLDGSKIHADASKSQAVSYKRLLEIETQLKKEVAELFELGEQADQGEIQLPEGFVVQDEVVLRQDRLMKLAEAKAILDARAQDRYKSEKAEYDEKMREREAKARKRKRKHHGKTPKPPEAGPRDKDQYNFTDPQSRIMKNSTNDGFDQHYNVQAAVEQNSMLIVATSLSNHPNDKKEVEPTLQALSAELGKPDAAALDNGFFSEANICLLEGHGIEPYIATGREAHRKDLNVLLGKLPEEPVSDASPKEKMAYKLATEIGQAIYRLRKCTVEPVIGIIKEIMGFRQFSLRGLKKVTGEWCLVCLAFNLKRMHVLMTG
jgi:transposase